MLTNLADVDAPDIRLSQDLGQDLGRDLGQDLGTDLGQDLEKSKKQI